MAAEEDDGAKQDGDRKDWEGIAKLWVCMIDLWLPRGAQRVVSLTGPFSSSSANPARSLLMSNELSRLRALHCIRLAFECL
jgi:hypothetical protein